MNKQRYSLSVDAKIKILRDVENGIKPREICKKFGIHKSTITKIKQNKESIERFTSETCINPKIIKRMRHAQYEEVENLLHSWFLQQRALKKNVTNDLLKIKAKEIHKNLGDSQRFLVSDGWLSKFKKRYGIRILTISGEKLSGKPRFLEIFKKTIEENNFLPEQIYNCDQTSFLIYKGLRKKANTARHEKSERVTIMPCVNATGTHKLELMLNGRSNNPRRFKDMKVPLYYKSTKKAWQTTIIFKNWFYNEFIPQVTNHLRSKGLPVKALLMMDNATCRGTKNLFCENENFQVLYFPRNMKPILQPLDQHIIKTMKRRYHKQLLKFLAVAANFGEMSALLKKMCLKDMYYLIIQAWQDVPQSAIQNSFKHLFSSIEDIELNLPVNHFDEEDDIPISQLYRTLLIEVNNKDDDNDNANINMVIDSFNNTIEWAEQNHFTSNEILLLRRMREKAVFKMLN